MSNEMAILADHLTRESTTKEEDIQRIKHVKWNTPKGEIITWLKNPHPDWDLPNKII